MTVRLTPGRVGLDDWGRIREGAAVELDPACRPRVDASADTVARLVAERDRIVADSDD